MAVPNKLDRAIWSSVDRFLSDGWATLVAAAPAIDSATREVEPAAIAAMMSPFAAWGIAAPDELQQWIAPLGPQVPVLAELQLGSLAPALTPGGNLAEQRLLAAQQYPPLWQEIFAGVFEIGSTQSGDIWMLGCEPFTPGPSTIYLYSHEGDALASPQARSLSALVFRAALYGARDAGTLDEADVLALRELLAGQVGTACFEYDLEDLGGDPVPWGTGASTHKRAHWLARLLSVEDVCDAELRAAFSAKLNPRPTPGVVAQRAPRFADFPPTAFYTCLSAWFSGDDVVLDEAVALARASRAPITRDLAVLIDELRAGRPGLGAIRDIQAVRERVRALGLWDPHPTTVAAHALESSTDPAIAATIAQLSNLRGANGYRNDAAIAALVAEGDRRAAPVLVARALGNELPIRSIYLDVLAEWADPDTVEPLLPLGHTVNRFHIERVALTRLIHGTWQARHAAALVAIARQFPAERITAMAREMMANLVLALGDIAAPGDPAAAAVVSGLLDTTIDSRGHATPIGLRDAVLYAAGELALDTAFPALWTLGQGRDLWRSPGLAWALGQLAARQPSEIRTAVQAALDAARVSHQTVQHRDGTVTPRSIASLLDPQIGNQLGDLAREIALEHARVALGAADDALHALVSGVLRSWAEHRQSGQWSGYDADAVLCWALIALRHRPDLGRDLARPFAALSPSSVGLARTLARRILAET